MFLEYPSVIISYYFFKGRVPPT